MDRSSSSSEDESMTEALKEATDQHFFRESFFSRKLSEDKKNKEKPTDSCEQKSLRLDMNHKKEFNIFGVSDAFRDHVAQNLYKLLDKSVEFEDEMERPLSATEHKETNLGCGIRLLSTFSAVVCEKDEKDIEKDHSARNKRRCKTRLTKKDDVIPHKVKIEEAAVNPEWILSKCETKAWVNRRKEAEFKYKKLQDGTLVSVL